MAIALLIFVLFPVLDFLTSKLLWYMFMISGSLQSFQDFLFSLNMLIIVILQSMSDYSIFDVFVSLFLFLVSAVFLSFIFSCKLGMLDCMLQMAFKNYFVETVCGKDTDYFLVGRIFVAGVKGS